MNIPAAKKNVRAIVSPAKIRETVSHGAQKRNGAADHGTIQLSVSRRGDLTGEPGVRIIRQQHAANVPIAPQVGDDPAVAWPQSGRRSRAGVRFRAVIFSERGFV
jgi:hypothetical protein